MKRVILTYSTNNNKLKIEVYTLYLLQHGEYTDVGNEIISSEVFCDLDKKYVIPKEKNVLETFIKGLFKESNTIRGLIGDDEFITDIKII